MTYLLDTNAVIGLLTGRDCNLARRVRAVPPSAVAISAIVLHELYYGAFKSQRVAENVERVDLFRFTVLPFDEADAREAGALRADLARSGRPVGPYDVLIAGQARARNLTLVTHNIREFARVPGLRVEDWEGETGS